MRLEATRARFEAEWRADQDSVTKRDASAVWSLSGARDIMSRFRAARFVQNSTDTAYVAGSELRIEECTTCRAWPELVALAKTHLTPVAPPPVEPLDVCAAQPSARAAPPRR